MKLIKSKLNDKWYKKYKTLFNYDIKKFNFINIKLLFNFIYTDDSTLCNYNFENYNEYYY